MTLLRRRVDMFKDATLDIAVPAQKSLLSFTFRKYSV